VNTCSVYSLEALQANFEDPFLEPPTHSCENILLSFELYEIEISVAASIASSLISYCSQLAVLSLYCSSMSSCDFHVVF
jgi:hypothetical protein